MKIILTTEEMFKKDEYGLYIHADNYGETRANIITSEKNYDKIKPHRLPKWIHKIFSTL